MNDMLTDTMSDDAVIARLRSALDEVATTGGPITAETPDGFDASVLPLRTASAGRRPARTWIGVAAATVVLMGGAGWALSQRTSPTATGADTTLDSTPSVTDPTATPLPDTGDAPWYTVGLADAVPGGISTATSDDPSGGFTQSWVINGPNGDTTSLGLLIIDVSYTDVGLPPDQSIYTETDAPQGTAWLLTDPGSPTSGSPSLVWQRTDGTAWSVTQAGLIGPADADGSAFADYVFQVQRGTFNDLLSNPDERAEWVGASPTNQRIDYTQSYAVGGVDTAIVLGVGNTSPLNALATATGITDTSVAGNRAWRGTQADGETTVVWGIDSSTIPATSSAAAQQWWGILRISPVLGDRVDEVLASVARAASATPTVTADAGAQPWFELGLADAEAGMVDAGELSGVGYSVWQIDDLPTDAGPASGYLVLTTLSPEMSATYPTDDPGAVELDGFPEGTATLSGPDADDPNAIVWKRSDGTTWLISQRGLVPTAPLGQQPFIDLARSLTPGSGVPVVLPSPSATLLGATTSARLANQEYSVGAENCPLEVSVANWPSVVDLAPGAPTSNTTVLGFPGLMGVGDDGATLVTWDAGNGWWGGLSIASCAADRVDEIIASLVPTVLPGSTGPVPSDPTGPEATAPQPSATKPADAPSYVLDDPAFSVEMTNGVLDLGVGTMPRGAVWTVDQTDLGAPVGYVFGTAFDWGGMPYDADGVTYLDVSRNGVEAVLYVGDPTTDPPNDPQVYFPQADGVVWVFEGANLFATGDDPYAALVDLAFALSNETFASGSGSGSTPALPVTQFGNGSFASREYDDTYTTSSGGIIKVTVHEGFARGLALPTVTFADITSTTVLDRPALVVTLDDGSAQVVWQAADGSPWWASLTFSAASDPALVDQAIAALRPA
jgi:hypothetical protein